jgi:hypothetical protein
VQAAESDLVANVRLSKSGSRWAATGVRNDRGAHQEAMEDHDRRFCHPTVADLAFLTPFQGPQ